MEKEYFVEVKLDFSISIMAESEEQAVAYVKENFLQDHRIELADVEITVSEAAYDGCINYEDDEMYDESIQEDNDSPDYEGY